MGPTFGIWATWALWVPQLGYAKWEQRDNVIVSLPFNYNQNELEWRVWAARAAMYVLMACLAVNAVCFFGGFSTFDVGLSVFRELCSRTQTQIMAGRALSAVPPCSRHADPNARSNVGACAGVVRRPDIPFDRWPPARTHGDQQGALPVPVVHHPGLLRAAASRRSVDAPLAAPHRKEAPLLSGRFGVAGTPTHARERARHLVACLCGSLESLFSQCGVGGAA